MMNLNLPGENRISKIFWCIMLLSAGLALGFAVYELPGFTSLQLVVLAISFIISLIVNQHQFHLPQTRKSVSAKDLILFWGTIWLGIAGAVLLTVSVMIGQLFIRNKKVEWKFGFFQNVVSIFAAAIVFYLTLFFSIGFTGKAVGQQTINNKWFFAATVLMAVVYYLITNLSASIFFKIENGKSFQNSGIQKYFWTGIIYVCTVLLTFLAHFSLLEFGVSFGWVVLAVVIGGHITNKIYLAKLEQKTKEIVDSSRIHLATVEALATAIDARDQVGVGHVRRTQIYAVGIGEALGLPEGEIKALRTSALLHDIGKLAVPDHILNKPGRLTPAEIEKMKIHSSVGAAILEKVGFTYPVVPTVKHHHEKWDGSGYPDGLKGEEIPLTARILSVADVYDALRGMRSYRDSISREEARKFLINSAGKEFDPKVVDVFLRHLNILEDRIEADGLAYSFDSENEVFHISEADEKQGYVQQIKRANREVFTLYELARVFSSSLNLQDTLSLFTEKIGELVPFDTCIIYLLDETGFEAAVAHIEGKNREVLENKRIRVGQGATGFVLKKQQPVFNVNPGLDFSLNKIEFIEEYSAMISLPLLVNEKILGAVSLYSCELENYGEEHLRLLETVSRIASDAISKTLYHAETESKALTDPMTGLPNARSLQMQFEKEAARAERSNQNFQVLMLDLDGFKAVNDTFGHKVGDEMLKGLAKVMKAQLRDYDFLARYAGDEFAAIIPETEPDAVRELCFRLERAVCEFTMLVEGRVARVGVSIGAASYPKSGSTLDQMIVAADKAMYSVKARHKQREEQANRKPVSKTTEPENFKNAAAEKYFEEGFIIELDESHVVSSAIN